MQADTWAAEPVSSASLVSPQDEEDARRILASSNLKKVCGGCKGPDMAELDIFVSFEFDKDIDLKNSFYGQAKSESHHKLRNCSLNEAYPDRSWQDRARAAIAGCDVVIVLIGEDTHNAPGIKVETDIGQRLKKPIIQIRPQNRPYRGIAGLGDPIPWKWKTINAKLASLSRHSKRS